LSNFAGVSGHVEGIGQLGDELVRGGENLPGGGVDHCPALRGEPVVPLAVVPQRCMIAVKRQAVVLQADLLSTPPQVDPVTPAARADFYLQLWARACLLTHRASVLHSGLMVRAGVISDELWALLEPVLPGVAGRPGRPWNDHRRTLEGIVWRFRTGSPWRDLPSEFGVYQSVWERHRRWSSDGTYNTMFAAVKADATDEDRQLMGTISVDSTSIRAHQHAAGARFHDHTGGTTE